MTDKIYELMDGTLPPEARRQLFSELASDTVMQDELVEQIRIRDAVNSDKRSFVPSPESTLGIMQRVGIGTAAGLASSGAKTVATGNSIYAIILGLTGLLFSWMLFDAGDGKGVTGIDSGISKKESELNHDFEGAEASATEAISTNDNIANNNVLIDSLEKSNSYLNSLYESQNDELAALKDRYANVESTIASLEDQNGKLYRDNRLLANEIAQISSSESINENTSEPTIVYKETISQSGVYDAYKSTDNGLFVWNDGAESNSVPTQSNTVFVPQLMPNSGAGDLLMTLKNNTNSDNDGKYSLSLLGSAYGHEREPMLAPENYAAFNNMGITGTARLFKIGAGNLELDLGYRIENFSIAYPLRDGDPTSPTVLQQPNYMTLSGGLAYRYPLSFALDGLSARASLGAGPSFSANVFAIGGANIRPSLGIDYDFYGSTFMRLQYDYSYFIYAANGQQFNTYKNGATFGVGVRF
ncbi:MAG: hypothetical protein Kapaf2KO_11050 [Candidatus Kapaibacteriales bacterium]